MEQTIYSYSSVTLELTGQGTAEQSPLDEEGVFLIPACATVVPPPDPVEGKAIVWNRGDELWELVDDFRDTPIWNTTTKQQRLMFELGPIPEGWTDQEPGEFDEWGGEAWEQDTSAADAAAWSARQSEAQELLLKSDMTAIRCVKGSVAFPSEWLSYVQDLRDIVNAASGDAAAPLPTRPLYPVGS